MDGGFVVAGVALAISAASAFFAWGSVRHARRSADAAEAQVIGQRESNIAAAEPNVWVDVRPNEHQGTLLEVVLGNAGPTVARNVRVTFEPPLEPEEAMAERAERALQRLAEGIGALPPGRTMRWTVGRGFALLSDDVPRVHRVLVRAEGPFGPLDDLEYDIDLADMRESIDDPPGSLHRLTKAVDSVAKELKRR